MFGKRHDSASNGHWLVSIVVIILLAFIVSLSVVIGNTWMLSYPTTRPTIDPIEIPYTLNYNRSLSNLLNVLRFKTISNDGTVEEDFYDEFVKQNEFLERTYPNMFSRLERIRGPFSNLSLLFRWRGSDLSLKPLLLMSHLDVVPVEDGTEDLWDAPPFAGEVRDGYIYGRGTMDIKGAAVALMESVESLLKTNATGTASRFVPRRSIYIMFPHDEEIGGGGGSKKIAKYFQQLRSLNFYPELKNGFELVLDEGGGLITNAFPHYPSKIAMVGVAEKGYLSIQLDAEMDGGHSSMPRSSTTAIQAIADAISALSHNPMPIQISPTWKKMMQMLAPFFPVPFRTLVSNFWLFKFALNYVLPVNPSLESAIRTTMVPTIFHSGQKENVIPRRASAVLNFRLNPGDTTTKLMDHIRNVLKGIPVNFTKVSSISNGEFSFESNPSPESRMDSVGWQIITESISDQFGDIMILPSVCTGGTDSRYFYGMSDSIYRFVGMTMDKSDLNRFHSTNERIHETDYKNMITFWTKVILRSQIRLGADQIGEEDHHWNHEL